MENVGVPEVEVAAAQMEHQHPVRVVELDPARQWAEADDSPGDALHLRLAAAWGEALAVPRSPHEAAAGVLGGAQHARGSAARQQREALGLARSGVEPLASRLGVVEATGVGARLLLRREVAGPSRVGHSHDDAPRGRADPVLALPRVADGDSIVGDSGAHAASLPLAQSSSQSWRTRRCPLPVMHA